jgi:hypothetical protein
MRDHPSRSPRFKFRTRKPYTRQKLKTNTWVLDSPILNQAIRFIREQGISNMVEINYAVTHSGPAHRDDVLSVALALSLEGNIPVYRRNPTPEELDSPNVLILDTGERHEPELNNFDHHQLEDEDNPSVPCRFT